MAVCSANAGGRLLTHLFALSLIPFNKPFLIGNELEYIRQAVEAGKLSGDGMFTRKCHQWLEQRYGFGKALLTTSCTDALEMAALLLRIAPGDEVIMPAYTFVSTANAFVLRGATIRFCDVREDTFNIDAEKAAALITPRTRAIVPVHYAGVACDMDELMALGARHGIAVVEDAAQAIDATYKGRPLGSIGQLATFSFHETKNVIAGEGGALVVNDLQYAERAEIIREKGTNRSQFFRGEANKYEWKDLGSSFLPSELTAAYLFAQLENLPRIQEKRLALWQRYEEALRPLELAGKLRLPVIPEYAQHNANLFYLLTHSLDERSALLAHLQQRGVKAVFHYLPLHESSFFRAQHDGRELPVTDWVSDRIVRLPLFYTLSEAEQAQIIAAVQQFYGAP